MKKKLILLCSILALVLSVVFISTNNVSAAEEEEVLPEEQVDSLYELCWNIANMGCEDYYDNYLELILHTYQGDFEAFLENGSHVDEVFNDIWEAGFFYWFDSSIDSTDYYFRKVVSQFTPENWCDYAYYYGKWLAVENLYCEFDFCDLDVINAVHDLNSGMTELLDLYDYYYYSDKGYNDGLVDGREEIENKYADYELKCILGPFYNGVYYGFINHDLTSSSVPTEFLQEYKNNKTLLEGRYFDLDYIIRSIHSDLGDGALSSTSTTSFTIYFIPGDPIKITSLDFSIKGVDGLSLIDENGSTYYYSNNMHVGSFDNFTFKDVSSDVFIGAIIFHIDNYSEFVKNDGFFRYNGINSIFYEGYDKGYINGSSLADSKYEEGYDTGYDKGFSDGENVGFNKGVLEKNPVTLRTLFWTIAGLPFETFKHVVNFDFLGYNVASVFTGLVTTLCVIWCVKRFFL